MNATAISTAKAAAAKPASTATENKKYQLTWQTPIGPMTGEISERGLRALRFPDAGARRIGPGAMAEQPAVWLEEPAAGPSDQPEAIQAIANQTTRALEAFFTAGPINALPPLDWSGVSPFDQAVWAETAKIPYGQTLSYGGLADRLGRPGAARAVGGALGRNPIVLLVPCHRVVAAATGRHPARLICRRLCGFTGGLDLKAWLLRHEGHDLP